MNWYLQSGKQSDVVFNTKIEYSRNFRNYKFQTNNKSEIEQIENEIKSKLPSLGYGLKFCKLKDMDNLTKNSLVEKGLINKNMAKDKNEVYSILVNDEENICIMFLQVTDIQLTWSAQAEAMKKASPMKTAIHLHMTETMSAIAVMPFNT